METVGDIMTRSVLAVRPETPLKEVARLLVERRISGLPVVDDAGRVLGVVSEADLLVKEQDPEALPRRPLARIFGDSAETRRLLAKAEARTAGDAMTAPAITIDAGQSVHAAAALMIGRKVNRLPVIADGRLVGIVTRADIVRTFVRTDEELAEAIRGEVERRATVAMVERMVEMVPGVVGVTVHLAWSIDDQAFEAPAPDYFSPKGPS